MVTKQNLNLQHAYTCKKIKAGGKQRGVLLSRPTCKFSRGNPLASVASKKMSYLEKSESSEHSLGTGRHGAQSENTKSKYYSFAPNLSTAMLSMASIPRSPHFYMEKINTDTLSKHHYTNFGIHSFFGRGGHTLNQKYHILLQKTGSLKQSQGCCHIGSGYWTGSTV